MKYVSPTTVPLILAAATILSHGWSLGDGLWIDDHWHQSELRGRGWSFHDLLESTTLEPSQWMNAWWQDQTVKWQYSRPFSVLVMKLVMVATGGSIIALHAISVSLHFASAWLVYVLCRRLTEHLNWSLVGGLLFVVYSHSVFAVSWIAAQNTVLQTTLTLGALIVYLRASGLVIGPDANSTQINSFRWPTFLVCLVLYVPALFTRENAVMLPVLAVAFDLAFGGWRWVRSRVGPYAVFAVVTLAFIVWRLVVYYHPLPGVYYRHFDGAGWLLWAGIKLMHYLTSAVWLSPMSVGPSGRIDPVSEVPGDCLLMLGILTVMSWGYFRACHGTQGSARGWWIWPLWLVLSVLPVVPVMATPHSGYLCGVGFAVAMVLGPGLRDRLRPRGIGRWSPIVAGWFLIATSSYIPIYRTLWKANVAAEHYTIAGITAEPLDTQVRHIFLLNLPFVNIYAKPCLAEVWGERMGDVQVHVLTYAPEMTRMGFPFEIRQIDERRFTVQIEEAEYFSGLLGQFLVQVMRDDGPFKPDDWIAGEVFDVEILDAGPSGVRKLMFEFHHPLADRQFAFYAATQDDPVVKLTFGEDGTNLVVIKPTPANDRIARLYRARQWHYDAIDLTSKIIQTDLYLTGPPHAGPEANQ